MPALTLYRPAVRQLLTDLTFRAWTPAQGPLAPHLTSCWLSRENAGRYSLIVPAMYGPLDWLRQVSVDTVANAIDHELVRLGEPQPMPVYNYGGPYRWRTIQQGQPLTLTRAGRTAVGR